MGREGWRCLSQWAGVANEKLLKNAKSVKFEHLASFQLAKCSNLHGF
jgi:hypothetical protein